MGLLLVLVLLAIYFVSLRGANASTAASTLRLALPHRHAHERGGVIAVVPGVSLRRARLVFETTTFRRMSLRGPVGPKRIFFSTKSILDHKLQLRARPFAIMLMVTFVAGTRGPLFLYLITNFASKQIQWTRRLVAHLMPIFS